MADVSLASVESLFVLLHVYDGIMFEPYLPVYANRGGIEMAEIETVAQSAYASTALIQWDASAPPVICGVSVDVFMSLDRLVL